MPSLSVIVSSGDARGKGTRDAHRVQNSCEKHDARMHAHTNARTHSPRGEREGREGREAKFGCRPAPALYRCTTQALKPAGMQRCSGVRPALFCAFGFAPPSQSICGGQARFPCQISYAIEIPCLQAPITCAMQRRRGSSCGALRRTGHMHKRTFTICLWSDWAARCSAVMPWLSAAEGSVPPRPSIFSTCQDTCV